MDTYFNNKVAVVTGGGGTICSRVAIDLASRGVKICLVGRTESKLLKTADAIGEVGGECMIWACDVTDEKAVTAMADAVYKKWGACHYLINGAGGNNSAAMPSIIQYDPRELAEDKPEDLKGFYNIDMDAFESVIRINTMGTVIPIRVFAHRMAKDGGGSIINFASMNSYCPLTRCFAYAKSLTTPPPVASARPRISAAASATCWMNGLPPLLPV